MKSARGAQPKTQLEEKELEEENPADTYFVVKSLYRQMSQENLKRRNQTNIIDKEQDIEPLNLMAGSIIEHIPTYNELFNGGKTKVFPMQSLEQIVNDPQKFQYTLKAIKRNLEIKRNNIRNQKMILNRVHVD